MIKVNAVEIEFDDGKTIKLSLAEAKALHSELDMLFGNKYYTKPYNPWGEISDPLRWVTTSSYSYSTDAGTRKIKMS